MTASYAMLAAMKASGRPLRLAGPAQLEAAPPGGPPGSWQARQQQAGIRPGRLSQDSSVATVGH